MENQRIDRVLCDSNIFIEVFRKNWLMRTELETIGLDNIVVSDVTRAELFVGAKDKMELSVIRKYINGFHILHIQQAISEQAVNLVEKYSLAHRLWLPDALIAATAIYHNIPLFTLNLKDFAFLPDIKLYQKS